MPELIEVERYRRAAEEVLGATVAGVEILDPRMIRDGTSPQAFTGALVGAELTAARRRGKLLVLDTARAGEPGPSLGIRFGMTGGLLVAGTPVIDRLLYSSATIGEQWIRFRLALADGRALALHDPRRFASVLLDPDEEALGPDALVVTPAALAGLLGAGRPPGPALKARLMDQARLAGLGNLLVDEILWRAGLAPDRPSGGLSPAELRRLHRHIRRTLEELDRAGGSHLGHLMSERRPGGHCPKDGTSLRSATIGGRTSWWCPGHQV